MSKLRIGRGLFLPALLVLVAGVMRFWRLGELPPGFHYDESFEGLEALRILSEPGYWPIYLTGDFGIPPLNAYANALMFGAVQALGGEPGPTAMRSTAALFGMLGVLAVWGLGWEIHKRSGVATMAWLPWLAAFTLAGMRWHVHFSRMGIEPIIVPLIWASALWLLLRAWRTAAWWAFAGCGLVLAVGMYAYPGAWVIPFLAAATALHLLWVDGRPEWPRRRLAGLVLTGGVALAVVLPLLIFFAANPEWLWKRPAQLAIVGETGSQGDNSIGAALWATAKMFGPFGSPGDLDPRRNLPHAPALNLWQAIPFYVGLGWALWRIRRPEIGLLVLGVIGLLLPGILSEYAPHFHRVLGAAGPTALLCGLGLGVLGQAAARLPATIPAARVVPVGGVVLLLGLGIGVGAHKYFVRWATLPDLYYAFDVGFWEVGQWVADLPADARVYVTPRGTEHATLAFAWRARPDEQTTSPKPIAFDGRHVFPFTAGANPSVERYVVVEHEDWRTPLLLPEVFPQATVEPISRDAQGEIYAQVYTRSANTPAARPPQHSLAAALGDGIRLQGYDVLPEEPRAAGSLYVQLHWEVTAAPEQEWTVFRHVVDDTGTVVASFDAPPGQGALSTTRWQAGWRVLDEAELALPADLAPGVYQLRAGLYTVDAGAIRARLPADTSGVLLGEVTLGAAK